MQARQRAGGRAAPQRRCSARVCARTPMSARPGTSSEAGVSSHASSQLHARPERHALTAARVRSSKDTQTRPDLGTRQDRPRWASVARACTSRSYACSCVQATPVREGGRLATSALAADARVFAGIQQQHHGASATCEAHARGCRYAMVSARVRRAGQPAASSSCSCAPRFGARDAPCTAVRQSRGCRPSGRCWVALD